MKTLVGIIISSTLFGLYFAYHSGVQPFEPGAVIFRWHSALQALWINSAAAFYLQLYIVNGVGTMLGNRKWLETAIGKTLRSVNIVGRIRREIEKGAPGKREIGEGDKDDEENP